MNITVFIPCKSISTRIPHKNLQQIIPGVTLLEWTLMKYRSWFESNVRFVVATDCPVAKCIAESYKAEIFELLPVDLNDTRNAGCLFYEWLTYVDFHTWDVDSIAMLAQVTSPFTFKSEVIRAINHVMGYDHIVPRAFACNSRIIHKVGSIELSQEIKPTVGTCGNFWMTRPTGRQEYPRSGSFTNLSDGIEVNYLSAIDINTPEDLELTRLIARGTGIHTFKDC